MSSPALLIITADISDVYAVSLNAVSSNERGETAFPGCETAWVQDPAGLALGQVRGSEEEDLDGAGMPSGSVPSLTEAGCEPTASEQRGLSSLPFLGWPWWVSCPKHWGLRLSPGAVTTTQTGISAPFCGIVWLRLSLRPPARADDVGGPCPRLCGRLEPSPHRPGFGSAPDLPAVPRTLTCPGSHRRQNHFLGRTEWSGQCRGAAGIVPQLPMNQGLLSARWAEAAASTLRGRDRHPGAVRTRGQ